MKNEYRKIKSKGPLRAPSNKKYLKSRNYRKWNKKKLYPFRTLMPQGVGQKSVQILKSMSFLDGISLNTLLWTRKLVQTNFTRPSFFHAANKIYDETAKFHLRKAWWFPS